MENEILQILRSLQEDNKEIKSEIKELKFEINGVKCEINGVKSEINGVKSEIKEFKIKLDSVVEQTANLLEFRSEIIQKVDAIKDDLATVELVSAKNWADIAKLKAVK